MSRVYVIDPEDRPSRDHGPSVWANQNPVRRFDYGLRIMEAETIGWVSGNIVRMAIHGQTAVRPARPKSGICVERWQVFEDPAVGWVAWVKRPGDDARVLREAKDHRVELLIGGILLFVGAVLAALILVFLPQCQGGLHAGL